MRYQWQILKQCCNKKLFFWVTLSFILPLFYVINCLFLSYTPTFQIEELMMILGLNIKDGLMYFLFQILIIVYMVYQIYYYEIDYSLEYFALREKSIKWLLKKILLIFIFISIYSLIYFFFFNILVNNYVSLSMKLLINYYLWHVFLLILAVTLINFNRYKFVIVILTLLTCLVINYPGIIIFLILILLLINCLFFSYRNIYY